MASLLPKLRDQYAEFLDHVSLVHLRLLASPTCGGFRYGHPAAPHPAFLARRLNRTRARPKPDACHPLSELLTAPTALDGQTTRPLPLRSSVPECFNVYDTGPESSPACHRLRLWGLALASASPCADCHGAGTLGFTVSEVFILICAYSFRHPHFPPLHANVSTGASLLRERSPTPHSKNEGQASAGRLIPTILGASTLDE